VTPSERWKPLAEALLGKAEFTAPDVARAADFDLDAARRLWQALGFPPVADDERLFTRSDVEVLRTARELIESQNTDATLVQLTRVTGQSLARVADAQIAAAAERLERLRTTEAPADAALASLAERIEALVPNLERLLDYVWRRHLLSALLRRSALPGADHVQTVGFVDLVGFTALSQALDARELAAMVDRFEAIAYEHIPRRGAGSVRPMGVVLLLRRPLCGAASSQAGSDRPTTRTTCGPRRPSSARGRSDVRASVRW
jgi:adenylate cyclase